MLDIKWIRDNPQALVEALVKRGNGRSDARSSTVDDLIAKDEARRAHLGKLQERRSAATPPRRRSATPCAPRTSALAEKLKAEVGEIKAFIQAPKPRSASSTRR